MVPKGWVDYLSSDSMPNVYAEWVNAVHFCNSWWIWFISAGPSPLSPPLKQRPGVNPPPQQKGCRGGGAG